MKYGWNVRLPDSGRAREQRRVPSFKLFLISLNLDMDYILYKVEEINLSYDPIIYDPPDLEIDKSVILLEDRRYFRHGGVDLWCVPRLLVQALNGRRLGGMSTIEQQLVRTILGRYERTYIRKTREIALSLILKYRHNKLFLLRIYLATAYFGYRIRGCDEAANFLFGKSAGWLTSDEATLVASLLVYPLPRSLREAAIRDGCFPVTSVQDFFGYAEKIVPLWSEKLKRRYLYGMILNSRAKKTIYKIQRG